MTKEELIALADEGKAHIERIVTLYRIVATQFDEHGERVDYPVVFVNIHEGDSSVFDDPSYFTDGDDEEPLDDADAGKIAAAIARHETKL